MHSSAQSWITKKKPLVVVVSVVVLVLAIVSLIPDNPSSDEMGGRTDQFAYAAGTGLGRHLASAFPDARVRVLLAAQGRGGFSVTDLADGLEAELRGHVGDVERTWVGGRPDEAEEENESGEAEPAMSKADLVDALRGWESETDLVVFLFQPPAGLLKAWKGKPALAVASSNVTPLFDPIEKGVISAALAARPDAKIHDEGGRLIDPPSDPMKAFALCFQVLTPENVGAFKERYPYLVGRGPR